MNWRRKAVLLFAAAIVLLSLILTVLALREAEREKLVRERDIAEQQRRIVRTVIDQIKATISESEERIYQILRDAQGRPQGMEISQVCRRLLSSENIISEIFLVGKNGEVTFPLAEHLFTFSSQRVNLREAKVGIEAHELWRRAQDAEFRTRNYTLAVRIYRELLAGTNDVISQAVIQNHMGRCYAKAGNSLSAIKTYERMLTKCPDDAGIDGIPLGLIGLHQKGEIYTKLERKQDAVKTFLLLYEGLLSSRWTLAKNQFHYYNKQVKHKLDILLTEINDGISPTPEFQEWEELRELEESRLQSMDILEKIAHRIVPLIHSQRVEYKRTLEEFFHFSSIEGEDLFLISGTSLDSDNILGLRLDSNVLAERLLTLKQENAPLKKGWQLRISDQSGKMVEGSNIFPDSASQPIMTYSTTFDEGFPPWEIRIFQDDPDLPERQFLFRRNLYLLSVAAVMTALFLGGFMTIRSMSKELEIARLKEDFVATVSHELRTPLTSIRYLAELFQSGRVRSETKKREYYETLSTESERLSRLVENILDFSKIAAGMKQYRFEPMDTGSVLADIVARFQMQNGSEHSIQTKISEDLPEIQADKDAISRVLYNLLDNATKYSNQGTSIQVAVRTEEDSVAIEIQDQGIGISKDDLENVFEKFYRSPETVAKDIRGSGIGLTLVAHIVKAHGGEVRLVSEPGQGTTVTILLPIQWQDR